MLQNQQNGGSETGRQTHVHRRRRSGLDLTKRGSVPSYKLADVSISPRPYPLLPRSASSLLIHHMLASLKKAGPLARVSTSNLAVPPAHSLTTLAKGCPCRPAPFSFHTRVPVREPSQCSTHVPSSLSLALLTSPLVWYPDAKEHCRKES